MRSVFSDQLNYSLFKKMFLTKMVYNFIYLPILIIKMIGIVQNFHLGAFLMYSIINSIVSFKNIDFILV